MKTFLIKIGLRAIVGIVFSVAGFEKVLQPEAFAAAIKNYHMVPESLVNLLALGLPMTELGAGICLVIGIMPRVMGWLFSLLLISFIGAISYALWLGEPISCGCFGESEVSIGSMWNTFFRDWILLIITVCIIAMHAKRGQLISENVGKA
jgi:uncharacterized membrane protein YphA (DoxX/SURF4 family)